MPSPLSSLTFRALFTALLSGCLPPEAAKQLATVSHTVEVLRQSDDQRGRAYQRLAAQLENLERTYWSDKFCRAEKSDKGEKSEKNFHFAGRLAEFMGQVQAQIPETCTASNLENALIFMNTQAYANAYYLPGSDPTALVVARKEQFLDLFAARFLHPSTRFLVLVQPDEETAPARQAALQFGARFVAMLRKQFTPTNGPELRILGPHLLPCRMSMSIRRLYRSAMDNTLYGEPAEGRPRLRVWTFRSDC